jgi:hypothetical protein
VYFCRVAGRDQSFRSSRVHLRRTNGHHLDGAGFQLKTRNSILVPRGLLQPEAVVNWAPKKTIAAQSLSSLRWGKQRGSDSHIRHVLDGTVIAEALPRHVSGRSKRASYRSPRRRKLAPEQEAAIRASIGDCSLRSLAADFGVSHQTVRATLRTAGAADVGGGLAAE